MKRPFRARLGLDGYARALVRLASGATAQQLRLDGFISSRANCNDFLGSLHKLGRIHVSGWLQEEKRRPQAVYTYGQGQDVPSPAFTLRGRPAMPGFVACVDVVRSDLLAFEILLDTLEGRKVTVPQLVEATGLNPQTIRKALAVLTPKLAHRCGYRADRGNCPAAVFTLGVGKNVARQVKTLKERGRAYRNRLKFRSADSFGRMASALGVESADAGFWARHSTGEQA
jgi:hypothetical protein